MDKESIYTSTGIKYHRAYQVFESLRHGIGRPQSLQVSLTNRCNLSCVFCSVAERKLKQEWNLINLYCAIKAFTRIGIKTIEFSGGGEPLLYPNFDDIIMFSKARGFSIGLITNGLLLKNHDSILQLFDWIRISMVALDYQDEVELPESFPSYVTLGMSYIVGQKVYGNDHRRYKEIDVLNKIKEYAKRYNVSYVRIVPECMSDEDEMNQLHASYGTMIKDEFGHPFFFQPKKQKQAAACWMDAVKPWLNTDGYIYPCNSIPLNTDANRNFAPQYRLCHWTEIEKYYRNRGKESLDVSKCDRCTFCRNNEIIKGLIQPMEHEAFL